MNTTNEKMVTLDMLKNLSADLQSKRKEASNQTVAQQKALAAKSKKKPYKRQTKATRVRKLLAMEGMTIHDIAAKAKVTPSYVYQIRWLDNKTAGIASLKKPETEVIVGQVGTVQVGTDQVPYESPIAAAHTPGSPTYVFTVTEQAPAPKPTFWQRVRDFVGL